MHIGDFHEFLTSVSFFYSTVKLQELKENPHRNAKGTVIEAGLDKSKGPMATFIVQNATLKRGDVVICGEAFGKVSFSAVFKITQFEKEKIFNLICTFVNY